MPGFFFFNKDDREKLIETISQKVANKLMETGNLDVKKKKLEVQLLEVEIEKKQKEVAGKKLDSPPYPTEDYLNLKWWRSRFSLMKVEDRNFKELLRHKEYLSPQAIQGMWQAYGQMRAARTQARGAIVATGVLGTGLWIYQRVLSKEKKELDEQRKLKDEAISEINEQRKSLAEDKLLLPLINSQLQFADVHVRKLCGNNELCYKDYERGKEEVQKVVIGKIGSTSTISEIRR